MLVPEEEAPQEEDLNGEAMVEDEGSFCSDAGVPSTAVSPNVTNVLWRSPDVLEGPRVKKVESGR